jgi:DNA-binding Lrp family transcriptional regulator
MQLDVIDMRILRALQDDGRLSNQDLADQVAVAVCLSAPGACAGGGGLIRGYHAELDAVALGFELEAIVQVTLDRSRDDWHGEFLQQMKPLRK